MVSVNEATCHWTHAKWNPPAGRADPVAILERQSAQRIPELVPIRYGRMSASAFAFYRGGAAIMASDLAGTPTAGLRAQLCGDAHLLNFGMFETPERNLIFGLNDFDETLRGPFEWDVKRLAASFEIAGRDLGFDAHERKHAVLATVRAYREAMLGFASSGISMSGTPGCRRRRSRRISPVSPTAPRRKEAKKRINQALTRDHLRAYDRLVDRSGPSLRFASKPPLIVPVEELLDPEMRERYVDVVGSFLRQYRRA